MPIQTDKIPRPRRTPLAEEGEEGATVIGWQGIRCTLPPEWNLTGFSMDRDNGYLRIDGPQTGSMSVQIRWQDAVKPPEPRLSLYYLLAERWRVWRKLPALPAPKPDLKANLDKILKETAKQAKKNKASFDSTVKPERTEGEQGERTAMSFSWTGIGRGQGKIWYCSVCRRIVVAQVLGTQKQSALANVAAQLFATLHDHGVDGYDLWALYDLEMEVPTDFRLDEQKLLSGHLQLTFGRNGERIVVDRWGLANMTLKRFKVDEWFRNNAGVNLKRLTSHEDETRGHPVTRFEGSLSLFDRLKMLREARGALRRFATRYEGGAWNCPESNKIYSVQVYSNRRTIGLWSELVRRCRCHDGWVERAPMERERLDQEQVDGEGIRNEGVEQE
jgi:hypothetical protein